MDDAAHTSNQLPLGDNQPPASPPAPSTPPATEPTAAKPKAARAAGSGSRTKGKVPPNEGRKAIGARKKPSKAAPKAEAVEDGERQTVVLLTSRFRGRDGRAIARRTPVLVTVERGLQLIIQGYAREAVEGDKPPVAYLD